MPGSASSRGSLWTNDELVAATHTYLDMLAQQLAGADLNKSAVITELRAGPLARRTAGSVSLRFSNITEVLTLHGLPVLNGYRPREHVGRNVASQIWLAVQTHPLGRRLADAQQRPV